MDAQQLQELDVMCRQCASAATNGARALAGLESRFREALTHLEAPRTAAELGGLTELLLINTISMREANEKSADLFLKLSAFALGLLHEMGVEPLP